MPVVRIMIQNVGAMNLGGYYRRCGDVWIKTTLLQSSNCTQLSLNLR